MKKGYFLLLFYIGLSHHWREIGGAKRSSESDIGGGGVGVGDGGSGGEEEDGGPPYVEWCEDAGERRRVTADKCQVFPFAYPYPLCYCLSGIGVLRIESETGTVQEVQFSKKGCFSHKAIGLHNRTIVLHPFQFTQEDTVVGILGQDDQWEFHKVPNQEPLPASNEGTIVIYNGQLIDTNEDHAEGGALYCIQRNLDPELHQLVRQYKLGPDSIWILLNDTCDGGNYIGDMDLVSSANISTPENQMCNPICPSKIDNVDKSSRARAPEGMAEDGGDESYNQRKDCKPIPNDLKAKHKDLNERILKFSIERSFYDQQAVRKKFEPARSFKILDLLAKITTKYCRNAQIPHNFLEQALAYFKIAHEGQNGFEFSEFFSNENLFTIQRMLRRCLWALESPFYMSKGCESPEILKTYANESDPAVATPIRPTVNHQYFDHHVVLDIPWNMLDLANTVCVKGFAASYRMYHEMEQGIEQLFTPQLRKFWLYPDVSTYYYEHIFGPHWMTLARNLEKCVETAYMHQPRMSRLHRPAWISGLRQSSRHQGTIVDPICTRRRIDIPLVSDNYEIYCEKPLQGGGNSGGGAGDGHEKEGAEDRGNLEGVDENALPGQSMISGQNVGADGEASAVDLTNENENEKESAGGGAKPAKDADYITNDGQKENGDQENVLGQGEPSQSSDDGDYVSIDWPQSGRSPNDAGAGSGSDSDSEYVTIDWPNRSGQGAGAGPNGANSEGDGVFIDWPESGGSSSGKSGGVSIDWPQGGSNGGKSGGVSIDWPQGGSNGGKKGGVSIDWPQGSNNGKSGGVSIDWPQGGSNGGGKSDGVSIDWPQGGSSSSGKKGGVSIDWPQGQGQEQSPPGGDGDENGDGDDETNTGYIKLDWRPKKLSPIDSPSEGHPSGSVFIDWASHPQSPGSGAGGDSEGGPFIDWPSSSHNPGAGPDGNGIDIGPGTVSSEQDTFIDWPSGAVVNGETEMPVGPDHPEFPSDEPEQRETMIDWPLQGTDQSSSPSAFTPPGTSPTGDISLDWPSASHRPSSSSSGLLGPSFASTHGQQAVEIDWPNKGHEQGIDAQFQSSGETGDVLLDWPQENTEQYSQQGAGAERGYTSLDWPNPHTPGQGSGRGKDIFIDWPGSGSSGSSGSGGQNGLIHTQPNEDDVILDAPIPQQWIKLDWKKKKGAPSPSSPTSPNYQGGPEKELFNGETLDWPELHTNSESAEGYNVKLDWVPKSKRGRNAGHRGRGTNINGYINKEWPKSKEKEPETEPAFPVDYSPAPAPAPMKKGGRGRTAASKQPPTITTTITTAAGATSVESNEVDLDMPTTLPESQTESVAAMAFIDFPTTYSETNGNFKRQKAPLAKKPRPSGRTSHIISNDRKNDIPKPAPDTQLTWVSKQEKYRPNAVTTSAKDVNNLDETTQDEDQDEGVLLDLQEKSSQPAAATSNSNSKGQTSIDWPGAQTAGAGNGKSEISIDWPGSQPAGTGNGNDVETDQEEIPEGVLLDFHDDMEQEAIKGHSSSSSGAGQNQDESEPAPALAKQSQSEEVFIDWPKTGNQKGGADADEGAISGTADGIATGNSGSDSVFAETGDGELIDFPPDEQAGPALENTTPSVGKMEPEGGGDGDGDENETQDADVLIDFPADEAGAQGVDIDPTSAQSYIKLGWKSHSKPGSGKSKEEYVEIDWPIKDKKSDSASGTGTEAGAEETDVMIDFPADENPAAGSSAPPIQSQIGAEAGSESESVTADYITIDFPEDYNVNGISEQVELSPVDPGQGSDSGSGSGSDPQVDYSDYITIDFPPDNSNNNNNNENGGQISNPGGEESQSSATIPTTTSDDVYLDWMKSEGAIQNPGVPTTSESYIKIDWPSKKGGKNIKLSWPLKPGAGASVGSGSGSGRSIKKKPQSSSRSLGGGGTADSTFLYQEGKGPASSRNQRKNNENPDLLEYPNPEENLVSEDEPIQTRVNNPREEEIIASDENIEENQILPDEPVSNYEPEIRLPILPDPKSRVRTQKVNYDDGSYSTPPAPAPSSPNSGRTFGYPVFPDSAAIVGSHPANGKNSCPSNHQFAVDRKNCGRFWTCVPGGNRGSGLVLVLQCPPNTYFDLNAHDCVPGVCPHPNSNSVSASDRNSKIKSGQTNRHAQKQNQNRVATERQHNKNNNNNNNNNKNVNDNSYNSNYTHHVPTRKVPSDPFKKVTQPQPHLHQNRGGGQRRTNRNKIAEEKKGGKSKEAVAKPKRLRTSSATSVGVECKKSGEMWRIDADPEACINTFYSCVNIYGQWFVNTFQCPQDSHFDPSVSGGCKSGICTST